MTGLRTALDVEGVEHYLNSRLDKPTRLRAVQQTFPGVSRETFLAFAADRDEVGYIVRIDPPSGGSVPTSLRMEWDVYLRLWSSPVPVGEPLWFDEGLEFADGRAHMIRRMVDGSTHVDGVHDEGPEGDALRRHVAFQHAEHLARVHTLDWKAHGFDEVLDTPQSVGDGLRHQLGLWRGYWEKVRVQPMPVVSEALLWFEENLPPPGDRLSLIKGNNGLGEEIWKDNHIVALSDWELAEIGDPALDWAFSQGMLKLHDEAETLAHYAEHAGYEIDPVRLMWARTWMLFKVLVCSSCAIPSYESGRDRRPALATLGLMVKSLETILGSILDKDLEGASQSTGGLLG